MLKKKGIFCCNVLNCYQCLLQRAMGRGTMLWFIPENFLCSAQRLEQQLLSFKEKGRFGTDCCSWGNLSFIPHIQLLLPWHRPIAQQCIIHSRSRKVYFLRLNDQCRAQAFDQSSRVLDKLFHLLESEKYTVLPQFVQ